MSISALSKADFEPKPFDEAAERFGKKAALTSDVFERLTTEARNHAFRISGVHKASLIQAIRRQVEKAIRDGTPWPEVRRLLVALFDTEGVPKPALFRLRRMFQQNTQQAYNDARRDVLDEPEIAEAFPFRMYFTVGNGTPGINGVRPTHAALHRQVFRWDDAFWDAHTPPWEWGCRCTMVALTAGQVRRGRMKVRNLDYVRKRIRVTGQQKRGIEPHPSFVRGGFDLSKIDQDLRKALEEMGV